MHYHEIEKARRRLRHAGTVEDRAQFRQSMIARLHDDIEVLGHRKDAVQQDFRKRLATWETRTVPEQAPVLANPTDAHDSRLYRLTGWIALLCETGLAAWIFMRLGVPAWIGALAAFGITFTLHGVFLYVFEDEERPKETAYRIKRYAAIPAIIGFVIAVAGGALARYVTGKMAYVLLPLFSFSLWLGTLSLIVLAASLFTIAHLRGWALRHEKQFRGIDDACRASKAFLDQLETEERQSNPSENKPRMLLPEAVSQGKHSISAMILLGVLLLANAACATLVSDDSGSDDSSVPKAISPEADLQVFIDWSGSCVRPALDEAWMTVQAELPTIIEQYRIGKLIIWSFDQDGWCPKRNAELELPVPMTAERPKVDGGEWESFSNIRDAVREVEDREWEKRQAVVMDQYRHELGKTLTPLESAQILPDAKYSTPRSDIVGLFERISAMHDRRPQYVIVLTDMADTRRRVWPKLETPKIDVHALVLVVPAQASDAVLTLGKPLSGPEQFEARQHQIQEAASWVTLAPYFVRNIPELLKSRGSNAQ